MRHFRIHVLLGAALWFLPLTVQAQGLGGRFMYGFGGGTQQLYSDRAKTGFGFGGEGLLGYRLNDRLGATLALGYATLPFKQQSQKDSTKLLSLSTNTLYGNLLFDIELISNGKFHPYLMFGAGGYSFTVKGTSGTNKRFTDATGIGGLGFRLLVSPSVALNLNAAYHYTTSDNLDARIKGGNNDAYFSGRLGLTFFSGGGAASGEEGELFTEDEQAPIEETDENSEEFVEGGEEEGEAPSANETDFASRLDEMDNGKKAGDSGDMQE